MKALTPRTEWEYVPLCDRALPAEDQTVFILRAPTGVQAAQYEDNSAEILDGKYIVKHGTQNLMLLNFSLVDVKNFKNDKGEEIKLERDIERISFGVNPLTDNFLASIPRKIQMEISNEIYVGMTIGEQELKN